MKIANWKFFSLCGISSFLFCCLFIFQGFSAIDDPYNLVTQKLCFSNYGLYRFSIIWLSDWLGGGYQRIFKSESLIFARLGWVLINAATMTISVWMLSSYFKKVSLAIVFFAFLSVFISINNMMTLNYDNIPAFLLLLSIFILLRGLKNNEVNRVSIFFSGIVLGMDVMARFMYIAFLILPMLIIFYDFFWGRRYKMANYLKILGWFYIGLFASLGVLLVILFSYGRLEEYIKNITDLLLFRPNDFTDSHNAKLLLQRYLFDLRIGLKNSLIFITISLLAFIAFISINRNKKKVFEWVSTIFLFLIHVLLCRKLIWQMDIYPYIFSSMVCSLLLCIQLYRIHKNGVDSQNQYILPLLLLFSIIIPVFCFLGSDTGIWKSKYGMFLLFPLALLLPFHRKFGFFPNINNSLSLRFIQRYMYSIIISFLLVGLFADTTAVYNDSTNRYKLTCKIPSKNTRLIFSTKEKSEEIGLLLAELHKFISEKDTIICYNRIPFVHYLTNTYPALGTPWPFIMSKQLLSKKADCLIAKGSLPKIIVGCAINTRNSLWPKIRAIPYEEDIQKESVLQKKLIEPYYVQVYNDSIFKIYKLKIRPHTESSMITSSTYPYGDL